MGVPDHVAKLCEGQGPTTLRDAWSRALANGMASRSLTTTEKTFCQCRAKMGARSSGPVCDTPSVSKTARFRAGARRCRQAAANLNQCAPFFFPPCPASSPALHRHCARALWQAAPPSTGTSKRSTVEVTATDLSCVPGRANAARITTEGSASERLLVTHNGITHSSHGHRQLEEPTSQRDECEPAEPPAVLVLRVIPGEGQTSRVRSDNAQTSGPIRGGDGEAPTELENDSNITEECNGPRGDRQSRRTEQPLRSSVQTSRSPCPCSKSTGERAQVLHSGPRCVISGRKSSTHDAKRSCHAAASSPATSRCAAAPRGPSSQARRAHG